MMFDFDDVIRLGFGFYNPNHAAAMVCAVMPFCWGWKRSHGLGCLLNAAAFVALLLAQSRTGLLVSGFEAAAYWFCCKERSQLPNLKAHKVAVICVLVLVGFGLWLLSPRLMFDGSILNRPKIWLAGLQLFAANPSGVGLGNSGTVASAFLLRDIPEIRTMISAHITLLAELGWLIGVVWFAFIAWALLNAGRSPRAGIAFAGLVLSGCSSTIFDWPTLFDVSAFGGLGGVNWALSWLVFLLFVVLGVRLIARGAVENGRRLPTKLAVSAAAALVIVAAALLVPRGDAPIVRGGYAQSGKNPKTLVLYDDTWSLRKLLPCVKEPTLLPIHPVSRFPRDLKLDAFDRVILFGACREWAYLVKGATVLCGEDL